MAMYIMDGINGNNANFTRVQQGGIGFGTVLLGGCGINGVPTWMTGYVGMATADVKVGETAGGGLAGCAVMATFIYSLGIGGALLALDNE